MAQFKTQTHFFFLQCMRWSMSDVEPDNADDTQIDQNLVEAKFATSTLLIYNYLFLSQLKLTLDY